MNPPKRQSWWLSLALVITVPGSGVVGANGWEHTALSPETLISALSAPTAGVRQQAAHSLGFHSGKAVVAALLGALDAEEPDARVRQALYHSLGRIGDADAIEAVASCLEKEAEVAVRAVCAEALGGIPVDRAERLAAAVLEDPEKPVRLAAVRSLGAFSSTAAVESLLQYVDGNPLQVIAVMDSLGRTGHPDAIQGILPHLDVASPAAVLAAALKAAARLGSDAATDTVERIHNATADPVIRRLSLIALAASGSQQAGEGLQAALSDGDPLTRIQALQIIRDGGDPAMLVALLQSGIAGAKALYRRPVDEIDADTEAAIVDLALVNEYLRTVIALDASRGAALYEIVAGPPALPRNRPDLLKVAEGFYRARWQGIYGLGYAQSPFLHDILEAALKDRDHRLRSVAVRSMGVHAPGEFTDNLVSALSDSHHDVRRQAAAVLGRDPELKEVAPLIAVLKDPDARVRLEAARSLGYLGRAEARNELAWLADNDPDPKVREAAGFSLDSLTD